MAERQADARAYEAPVRLEQGDLRLLETEIATWTGELLTMPTFVAAPREYLAQIDQPGTRMARIDVRRLWVGVLDFQSRLPSALRGVT
jgi:hypothetical protein